MKETPNITIKTLKQAISYAEKHHLMQLKYRGIEIVRGGPPAPAPSAKPDQKSEIHLDPHSVEDMDGEIYKTIAPHFGIKE